MSRLLCCCLLFLASPAAAELIVISEGHYDQVNVPEGRELLFNGGTIEYLNANGGVATIDGGLLTGNFDTRPRVTLGGTVKFVSSNSSQNVSFESSVAGAQRDRVNNVVFEGRQFRFEGGAYRPSGTALRIQGLMMDGSWLNMNLFLYGDRDAHHIEFISHPELIDDPNGDGVYNLADLNIVRNNFGAQGGLSDGDIDGDGSIGLADLNHVRNNFGETWWLGEEYIFSGVYQFPTAVPEPSTIVLGLLMLLTAASFRIACK